MPGPRRKQWAAKTRTGCLTCRKRRVKCDETKPRCKRCIAVNRECVGLEYGINHDAGNLHSNSNNAPIVQHSLSLPQFNSSKDMMDLCRMMPELERKLLVTSERETPTEICLALSCSKLYYSLGMLPCRAGYEQSLDNAAKCVVMSLRERFLLGRLPDLQDKPIPGDCLQAYIDALKPLRQALSDPIRSQRPEVLCAAQLLGIFESMVQKRPHAPSQHVSGAEQLIKHRGIEGFKAPFEQSLLVAQVPVIIGHSLPKYQKPFLANDDWKGVLESCARTGTGYIDRKMIDMYQAHLGVCTLSPDVTAYLIGTTYDKVKHSSLLARVRGVLRQMSQWREVYGMRDLADVDTAISPGNSDTDSGFNSDTNSDTDSYVSSGDAGDETIACNTDTYTMMANRFYIALGGKGSVKLEQQTQQIATRLLERHSGRSNTAEDFTDGHVLLAMGAARAMLATADEFAEFAGVGERAATNGRHAMVSGAVYKDLIHQYGFAVP